VFFSLKIALASLQTHRLRTALAVARAGNVVIGGDFYASRTHPGSGRLVVDCLDALMRGEEPILFAPLSSRPYTYGLDILAGYLRLMSQLGRTELRGEAFNFGPKEMQGTVNGELATQLCQLWDPVRGWVQGPTRPEPYPPQSICWDKARDWPGWRPLFSTPETLEATVAWYRAWHELRNVATPGCLAALNRRLILEHGRRERAADHTNGGQESPESPDHG